MTHNHTLYTGLHKVVTSQKDTVIDMYMLHSHIHICILFKLWPSVCTQNDSHVHTKKAIESTSVGSVIAIEKWTGPSYLIVTVTV